MISLTKKEKEFIKNNLPEVSADTDDVNDILLPLNEWMAINCYDEDDEITDEGREIEKMYDNIYDNN